MNLIAKKKLSAIVSASINFVSIGVICVALSYLMNDSYLSPIFVSGGSMNPTLLGGHNSGAYGPRYDRANDVMIPGDTVHFGLTDESKKAKENINRFDIVTTYYPWSDYPNGKLNKDADYKIKRVIALPNETFKIDEGLLYIKNKEGVFEYIETSFKVEDDGNVSIKDVTETTLKENEYWVMGDHRSHSTDCASMNKGKYNGPITIDNLIGVLVSIQGTAEFYYHYLCDNCANEIDDEQFLRGNIASCPKCGGSIVIGKGDIRNKQYTYPRII